jgi:hypothetical protein
MFWAVCFGLFDSRFYNSNLTNREVVIWTLKVPIETTL